MSILKCCIRSLVVVGSGGLIFLVSITPLMVHATTSAPIKIVVLGASTAAGKNLVESGSTLSQSWVNRYATYLSVTNPGSSVVNLAVSGSNTYQVLPTGTINPQGRSVVDTLHNVTKAISLKPNVILVNFPSDANKFQSTTEAVANLLAIQTAANAAGILVFVTTPQPIVTGASAPDTALRVAMRTQIIQTFGANVIDFWSVTTNSSGQALPGIIMSYDGIHPTEEAHRLFFELVKAKDIPTIVVSGTPPPPPVPAPTIVFTSVPSTVQNGGSTLLSWSSSNTTGCTASGSWNGALGKTGSQTLLNLTSNQNYALTCTGAGGSATQSVQVLVTNPNPDPNPIPTITPSLAFAANPVTIAKGGQTTLTWMGKNVTSCKPSGSWWDPVAVSGTMTISNIPENKLYKLTCTGPKGEISAIAAVSIVPGEVVQEKTKYTFTSTLAIGSRGEAVSALQKILVASGYLSVNPTGFFGNLTKAAVKEFQLANSLEPVGVVGPRTRALLNKNNSSR